MDVDHSKVPALSFVNVAFALEKGDNEHNEENHNNNLFYGQVGKNFTDFALFLAYFFHQLSIKQ